MPPGLLNYQRGWIRFGERSLVFHQRGKKKDGEGVPTRSISPQTTTNSLYRRRKGGEREREFEP